MNWKDETLNTITTIVIFIIIALVVAVVVLPPHIIRELIN